MSQNIQGVTFERNLIIFIAPSAGGKTEGINRLRGFLDFHGLPYQPHSMTDARFILEEVRKDDRETGGQNHYHEWCNEQTTGHSHENNEPDLGFTVTGQRIPTGMYRSFLGQLSEKRSSDRLYIAEWSGGVNGNPPDHPASKVDYSFTRMRQEMEAGTYPLDWIKHVLAVIHPWVPNFEERARLNELRFGITPSVEELEKGARSWHLPPDALTLFHGDDFEEGLRPFLEEQGLKDRIYTVQNGGENETLPSGENGYAARLEETFQKIFATHIGKEGQPLPFVEGGPSAAAQRRY
mgnify:CR=1 FL=1